jgi:hypothetical protein
MFDIPYSGTRRDASVAGPLDRAIPRTWCAPEGPFLAPLGSVIGSNRNSDPHRSTQAIDFACMSLTAAAVCLIGPCGLAFCFRSVSQGVQAMEKLPNWRTM